MAKSTLGNAGLIRKILKEEGFSEFGIRGALARMRQESSLNPKAFRANDAGPGKHSKGIFQWNRERLTGLENFARARGKSADDLETQVRWWVKEASTTEAQYGKRLKNATSDREAARAAISMARPKHWTAKNPEAGHGFKNTLNWTQDWAAKQTGESTEYYGRPEIDPSVKAAASAENAGKGFGRIAEEGDFNFDEFERVVGESVFENNDVPEIDNSPGAVAKQTILGFFTAVAAGVKGNEDGGEADEPPTGFNFKKEILSGTDSSPGVGQIAGMIKGMV